jgi:3-vinyl bacteriochlorophyllide hydratase
MRRMSEVSVINRLIDRVDCCPWDTLAGRIAVADRETSRAAVGALYTPDQRRRRDASPWTTVQGVLAPVQFAVFLVSLYLVLRYLRTGDGFGAATASVVAKTLVLYTIMITGSIWERAVFGRYLFTPAFFWEDTVSLLVLALHTLYLAVLISGAADADHLMVIALAAYAAYAVNASQYVLKMRAARRQGDGWPDTRIGRFGLSE